jgi:hypothetical protein
VPRPKDGWSGSFSPFDADRSLSRTASNGGEVMVNLKREVQIQVEWRGRSINPSLGLKEQKGIAESPRSGTFDDDDDEEEEEDVDREEGEDQEFER